MVRKVHVEVLCTRCHWEGEATLAKAIPITIDGAKGDVDLCDECRAEIIVPLQQMMIGEDPHRAKATDKKQPVFSCFMGDGHTGGPNTLSSHMRTAHRVNIGKITDRCPLCGETITGAQALGQHTSNAHGAHGMAGALWLAIEAGDPHGVVAEAQARVGAAAIEAIA